MSNDVLALASAANEAVIAYRHAQEDVTVLNHWRVLHRANELADAVDALTGVVVEQINEHGEELAALQAKFDRAVSCR